MIEQILGLLLLYEPFLYALLFLFIFLYFISSSIKCSSRKRSNNFLHARNVRVAKNCLETLREISDPRKQFAYLRKIDPFVFEEMILTSIQELGGKVIRNLRYTGDGGVDGRAVFLGKKLVIQVKRYSSYVSAKDIETLAIICKKECAIGIFVHTGKTGKKARQYSEYFKVQMFSGQKLLALLNAKNLKLSV